MICKNCNSDKNETDDRLGETVCMDCGYVMISNIFEEESQAGKGYGRTMVRGHDHWEREADRGFLGSIITNQHHNSWTGGNTKFAKKKAKRLQKNHLRFRQATKGRSINQGVLACIMVMAPHHMNDMPIIKERILSYYRTLFMSHSFKGFTMAERACGLVLYMLREDGVPVTVKNISKDNNVNPSRVSKCARRIASKLGKPWLLHQMPIFSWCDRLCYDLNLKQDFISDMHSVLAYVDEIVESHDITFTKTYMATTFWMTCLLRKGTSYPEITQAQISEVCGCSEVALRATHKKMLHMLKMTKKQCELLTVEQFVAGVKYG